MKKLQVILFVICFLIIVPCYSQTNQDTISVQIEILKDYFGEYQASMGIYIFKNDTVTKEDFYKRVAKQDSIRKYVNYKMMGHYCKFFEDTLLYEEGRWFLEYFTGQYKRYYRNSKLAKEGVYSDSKDINILGKQVGTWKYYTDDGKLSKKEVYDKKSRILKIEEYDKNGKLIVPKK